MTQQPTLVQERRDQILDEAIRDASPVAITHRTTEGWKSFKGRLSSGNHLDREFAVVFPSQADNDSLSQVRSSDTIGISFRVGHRKCVLSTQILGIRQEPRGWVLRARWPESMQQLQRRVFERASLPRGTVIAMRFWIEGNSGANDERQVKHGQLEDISAGGMRIKVSDTADVTCGAVYRCVFSPRPGAPAFVLDATLRHREIGDKGRFSLGFQFIGLETTPEGRKTLDRLAHLVSQFHRSSSRRRPHHHRNDGESSAPAAE